MIRKIAIPNTERIRIVFELPSCLWADRIHLVGDFNDWDETATPMYQERDGFWRTELDLSRGYTYEFRYLIDGQWMSDSHADGFAENCFGVSNSVIHTSLRATTLPVFGIGDSNHKSVSRYIRDKRQANHSTRPIYPAAIYPVGKMRLTG